MPAPGASYPSHLWPLPDGPRPAEGRQEGQVGVDSGGSTVDQRTARFLRRAVAAEADRWGFDPSENVRRNASCWGAQPGG